jgi:hypothetical protein
MNNKLIETKLPERNKELKIERLREELDEVGLRILEHWNAQKIIKHKPTLARLPRTMRIALKTHTEEEIKQAITNYAQEVHDADYKPFPTYKTYIWALPAFLHGPSRGPFMRYLNDGDKWINYCRNKGIELIQEINNSELNIKKPDPFPVPNPEIEKLYKQLIEWFTAIPYQEYLQTEHWKHFRDKALLNANNKCQVCNEPHQLQVHHRNYDNRGRETFLDVVVLCRSCHARMHLAKPN